MTNGFSLNGDTILLDLRNRTEFLNSNYQSALKVKKDAENGKALILSMKNALKTFEKLGNYKDSKALAESLRQLIAKEEERKADGNNAVKGLISIFVLIAVLVIYALMTRN